MKISNLRDISKFLALSIVCLLSASVAHADTIEIRGKKYDAVSFDQVFDVFEKMCDSDEKFPLAGQRIAVVGRIWGNGLNKNEVLLDRLFRPGGSDKRIFSKDLVQINVNLVPDMYQQSWISSCRPVSTFQGPDCNVLVYGRVAYEPKFERTLNYFSGGACVIFVNGYEFIGKSDTVSDDWRNFVKSFSNGFRVGEKIFNH